MPGGVSGYAAINARVRVMYSDLLGPQDLARLGEAPDFLSLIGNLKQTVYAPYLESSKDRELTPREAILGIKGRLADAYYSVIHMAPGPTQPLLTQLYRYYEVGNLKAILRAIVTGSSRGREESLWESIRYVLFPFGSMTVLSAQAMVETGNVAAAVELLHGTPYENTLSFAMKRYSIEQSLFPLEVALDLDYWRKLWGETQQLRGQDREQALRVVGSLVDMNNLMWAIRYRVYHQLSEEELINYTLPFGYHVRDEDIRAIAAGADIAAVVGRVFPELSDINAFVEKPRSGLPMLELQLKRHVMKRCMAAFLGNPFHIGIPLAYLVLSDLELQDLTVLIEAKSLQLADEEYMPYLVKATLAKE